MRRGIDYYAFRLIIFIILFFVFSFVAKTFLLAVLYALLSTFALSLIIDVIIKRSHGNSMSYSAFLQTAIIRGNAYILDLITALLHIDSPLIRDNQLTYTHNDVKIIIFNSLRFGNISPDEIIKLRNLAKAEGANELYMLARLLDRRSIAIANSFTDVKFIVISARRLYYMARKQKLIPRIKLEHAKKPGALKGIIQVMLSRNLAPKYLFTGAILAIMSIFTPLRTYYIVIASIALILAVLCLTGISTTIAPTKLGVFGAKPTKEKPPKE